MNTRVSLGIGLAVLIYIAGCGARVEIADSEYTGGAGGFGSSGSNGSGAGSGSSGGFTSSSGGFTSTSSGGFTSTSSGGFTSTSSGGMTGTSSGGMTGSSSGGMTGSSSSSSGGVICPGFGDNCTECLSVQCADIYCTCYNNSDCFALSGCLNGCNGNAACEQKCYTKYPNGASDLYALSSCAGMQCQVDCPGNQPLDTCTQCMVETCGDELDACLAFAPCMDLYNCLGGCGQVDLSCQQQCYASHGDGVSTLQSLLGCTQNKCPDC